MNEIVNKFLSAGDKIYPWSALKAARIYLYGYGSFPKNKERIQKAKETGDSWYIYQSKLDKTRLSSWQASGDFKNSTRRTVSDQILSYKAFNIVKNPKYDGYQRGLASMVHKYFDKKNFCFTCTVRDLNYVK